MFGFMKKHSEKDREDRDKKKREKKERKDKKKGDKSLTEEELSRLEEAKRGLWGRLSDSSTKYGARPYNGATSSQQGGESSESLSSSGKLSPRDSATPEPDSTTYTSIGKVELSSATVTVKRAPPAVQPKPSRGILKGQSNYGPEIPNQGVRGQLDDTMTLEENTVANEDYPEQVFDSLKREKPEGQPKKKRSVRSLVSHLEHDGLPSSTSPRKVVPPTKPARLPSTTVTASKSTSGTPKRRVLPKINMPSPIPDTDLPPQEPIPCSPAEKTYGNIPLALPSLAPPRCLAPREITLGRQLAGDFGFTLRRGTILERGVGDSTERKRVVIFAEPGPKNTQTGLLPGDRLIEVNGKNVESATREEVIELIKNSGGEVRLKVQPIPELSELSVRSGLEGEEVTIAEQSIKTGTLQRSGNIRYRARQAKSEDQLVAEKEWLSSQRVWLVHKAGFAAAQLLDTPEIAEGKVKVKVEHSGEVLEVDEEDIEKANPPKYDRVEDLATLRYLNESSVLHTLRQRYGSNLIHTYAGPSLLVVNPMHPLSIYSEKVMQMFRGCKSEDMPPHIYSVAQRAYRGMLGTRQDQSLVFIGRSGSGKTTSVRHALQYLSVTAGSVGALLSSEKLTAVFTLLDSFGNSRTIMNTSATRFTHLFSVDFDQAGQVAAASVQVLMLEKSRVVKRPEGEPTFHVFYQMLAGIDTELRKELQLENLGEPSVFMTPLQRQEDRQRATQAWAKIHHSLGLLGFRKDESMAIYSVLAAVYHLGVASCVKGQNNKYQFARPAAAQRAAAVLGTTVEALARSIFQVAPQNTLRAEKPGMATDNSLTGMEALEGFVMGLYMEAFQALVSLINRSLSSNVRTVSSILVLDAPGFQNAASCGRTGGATSEDFGHNYLQERLQLLYHDIVFTSQQDLYCQEDVTCDFEMVSYSPQPLVSLIDKPSQQALVRSSSHDARDKDQKGLLWLLDEEAMFSGATEKSFLEHLFQMHGQRPGKRDALLQRGGNQGQIFTLNHFQGTNPVQYNVKGWLKACRENPVSRTVNAFLQESNRDDIGTLFSSVRSALSVTMAGSVVSVDGTTSLRRTSSIRRTCATGAAGLKRKSACLQMKFQVDTVVESLRRTHLHFIHCLLPQSNAGLCDLKNSLGVQSKTDDILLNVPLVRSQIRGAEIVDAIRLHRQGFPEHMLFSEFKQRFELLTSGDQDAVPAELDTNDSKKMVQKILEHLEIDSATYRLGLSQVFFRAGGLAPLEDARDQKVTGVLIGLQSRCRGYLSRQKLKKLKLQHLAITCVQRNVRKYIAIREWPWWRLYTKIQPLLDVHRTEEELKERELELEQLRTKYEKADKERNDFRTVAEKLQAKLSEISVDLAEEHTTSSKATELLESETVGRMHMERELKDMTSKYHVLQKKLERTEMDLMQTNMMLTSLDAELDEDDVDGDIYKERYERTRREMEFLKKRLEQDKEEEAEKFESSKKHLERKLADAGEETEDQRRQVANLKRKSHRLTQDMQDMKLHLEEQLGRNSELEKKQRKFDSELRKVSEHLREEKQQREKLQREKDELAASKYGLEQEIKNSKIDTELQAEKLDRLERELLELSSHGNKDDKELVTLKRQKHDLERKLDDQEEELDDQAGTIQQLEQSKLKLEMAQEQMRQKHAKELDEKEEEMEDMRCSTQKKLKMVEAQLEEEYEEKQGIAKEKRELERKIQMMNDMKPTRDRDVEKRLRRDLKRTKTLLQDAQTMLAKQKDSTASRTTIKQLKNQLEDAEFATAAAVKSRKGMDLELEELQQQLDAALKGKQDIETRCSTLNREKNDLQSHLEENDEDMNEVMKKYKALVQQQTVDHITLQDQSKTIEELLQEKQQLKEQMLQLQSNIDFVQDTMVDKQMIVRLEAKIRELESRFDLEQTTRHRVEVQLSRAKEQLEKLTDDRDRKDGVDQRSQDESKRYQRQLRELQEEFVELQRKETEATQRKNELEVKLEMLEADYEQSQTDLRLAFKRITDLQAVIEEEMESGDDDSDYSREASEMSDSEYSDSDTDLETFLVNHRHSAVSSSNSVNQRYTQRLVSVSSTESSSTTPRRSGSEMTDESELVTVTTTGTSSRCSIHSENIMLNGSQYNTFDISDSDSCPDSAMATDGSSTISFLSFVSEDSDTLTLSSQYSNCWSPTSTLSMHERSVSQQDSVNSNRSPTLSPRTIRKKVYADGQYL